MSGGKSDAPAVRRRPAYLCAATATVLWLGAILATMPLVTLWKADALAGPRALPAASVGLMRFHDALRGGILVWLPLWLALQAAVVLAQHPRVPKGLRLALLVGATILPGLAAALLLFGLVVALRV